MGHRIHDAAKKGSIEDVAKLLKQYPQLVNDKVCGWTRQGGREGGREGRVEDKSRGRSVVSTRHQDIMRIATWKDFIYFSLVLLYSKPPLTHPPSLPPSLPLLPLLPRAKTGGPRSSAPATTTAWNSPNFLRNMVLTWEGTRMISRTLPCMRVVLMGISRLLSICSRRG